MFTIPCLQYPVYQCLELCYMYHFKILIPYMAAVHIHYVAIGIEIAPFPVKQSPIV